MLPMSLGGPTCAKTRQQGSCGIVFRVLPADTYDRISVVCVTWGAPTEALPLHLQHGQGQRDHRTVELWPPLAVGVPVLFLRRLNRVFDGLKGSDLGVVKLAANLFDLADVNILDDLARFRINRNRSARALPLHALH